MSFKTEKSRLFSHVGASKYYFFQLVVKKYLRVCYVASIMQSIGDTIAK